MKRILLTRSKEENRKIAGMLEGFEVISCPMLYYKDFNVDWKDFKEYSHIIITSKYAANLVSENYPFEVIAYVVGKESARLLEQNPNVTLGGVFDNVDLLNRHSEEAGRADAATQKKKSDLTAHNSLACFAPLAMTSKILYLSGNHISQKIPFATRKEIYHTEYADSIDPELFKEDIDYVLIYSKNSANNLIKLLGKHNLLQKIENSVSISLSENISDILKGYVRDSLYPEKPIADEMIKLLLENDRKEKQTKY